MNKALVQQGQRWYWTNMKPRYKFLYRSKGGLYFWENTTPVDSRVEQVYCNATWFWGQSPDYSRITGSVYYPRKVDE